MTTIDTIHRERNRIAASIRDSLNLLERLGVRVSSLSLVHHQTVGGPREIAHVDIELSIPACATSRLLEPINLQHPDG